MFGSDGFWFQPYSWCNLARIEPRRREEYYRHDNINVHAAMIIAAAVFVGGWVGAVAANRVSGPYLRLAFGVFVILLGLYLMAEAFRRLGWI